MDTRIPGEVTHLLRRASPSDRAALDELLPLVYRELHGLAQAKLRGDGQRHTLQPTALVNEAYLRLFGSKEKDWKDRKHFYRAAANAMRCILINHARDRRRQKRGGGAARVPLDDQMLLFEERALDLLDLEEALRVLEARDARQVDVVELRFFGGLTVRETAEVLGVSPRTVEDDWSFARAWLHRELTRGQSRDDRG
jgi:RNA polymerase sigma factor (TIGR02999 family)